MYTLEQRERAVELYVRYGRKATATMRVGTESDSCASIALS